MESTKTSGTGIARYVPGLALFSQFKPGQMRGELVAAVTVFAILVPSAMAYGDLAGVTPVAGLYVALVATRPTDVGKRASHPPAAVLFANLLAPLEPD